MGINEPEPNIRNKLVRGTLTTEFLILCLEAAGVPNGEAFRGLTI